MLEVRLSDWPNEIWIWTVVVFSVIDHQANFQEFVAQIEYSHAPVLRNELRKTLRVPQACARIEARLRQDFTRGDRCHARMYYIGYPFQRTSLK